MDEKTNPSAVGAALTRCRPRKPEAKLDFAMGQAMEHLRGRASGALVSAQIKKGLGL